jgi:hypothetical protein
VTAPYKPEGHDPDDLPWVCLTHHRFIPCRRDGTCFTSNRPEAVALIRAYQSGWTSYFKETTP